MMETYTSYHGPNAGFNSIKDAAEERGLSLTDREIWDLNNEMQYQAVVWVIKHLDKLSEK